MDYPLAVNFINNNNGQQRPTQINVQYATFIKYEIESTIQNSEIITIRIIIVNILGLTMNVHVRKLCFIIDCGFNMIPKVINDHKNLIS